MQKLFVSRRIGVLSATDGQLVPAQFANAWVFLAEVAEGVDVAGLAYEGERKSLGKDVED